MCSKLRPLMTDAQSFSEVIEALRSRLGTVVRLPVLRFGPPGAFLEVDPVEEGERAHTVLLPGKEVPPGTREGEELDVFLTLDSDDRPLATIHMPKVERGEVAFLRVTQLTSFGAFFDWGLPKELLVPIKEQTRDLAVGDVHAIGVYLDDTGRLAGTMRVSEMLRETGDFEQGEWVEGESWRHEPDIGVFVIVERSFVGLLPKTEPHSLRRGDSAKFRVANVLPDGKIELSLRAMAHEEIEGDAARILQGIAVVRIGDKSSPEEISRAFGISKKAFKRAVGRLLREGKVGIDDQGILVLKTPG